MSVATDIVARRDLLLNLTRAELASRYRTATLGVAWFVLTPLVMMVVLTIVFEGVFRLGIPDYPVFVLAGLLPWTFFQVTILNSSTSVSRAPALIKRASIPRVFLPVSAVCSNLVQYLISLALLVPLMVVFGVPFQPALLLLPVAVGLATAAIGGISLITAALNVAHRDVELLANAALRVLFYATPVFYPLSAVPEQWRTIYLLNPAAGIVEMHRSLIVYGVVPPPDVIIITTITTTILVVVGIVTFARREQDFEDYL